MITIRHLKFYRGDIFQGISPLKLPFLVYAWYGFPDITHFGVDNCCMSAIFKLIFNDLNLPETEPFA